MLRVCSALWLCLCPLLPAVEVAPLEVPADSGLQLSHVAQQLAACPETAEGLRQRLGIILHELRRNPFAYDTDYLPTPRLELIPVTVSSGSAHHLGGTQWAASATQVSFRMNFFTAALPAATDESSRLQRELILVDTLVHELAHCYFFARYPKLAKTESEAALTICEGYAIHVARLFMQRHYFPRHPNTGSFYENTFLSPAYRRYYHGFLKSYLKDGLLQWQLIDEQELRVAPPGYILRNRSQVGK